MRVTVAGGGVAGLSFALLCQKSLPSAVVRVVDRRSAPPPSGVVLSPDALSLLEQLDPGLEEELRPQLISLQGMQIQRGEERHTTSAFGMVGLSQAALWGALRQRAEAAGVRFEERPFSGRGDLPEGDLLVAADGEGSRLREELASAFRPSREEGKTEFCWVEAPPPLGAEAEFQFHFLPTPQGLLRVHAYPFAPGRWAWIAERPRRGSEGGSSGWRSFSTMRCENWFHQNLVLLGDAAHTTHFSIGMGTRLALEDALSLAQALKQHPELSQALAAYQAERKPRVERAQRVALRSAKWFEEVERWFSQPLPQFAFNLLSRTGRLLYDEVRAQDPALASGTPPIFAPFRLRTVELANRVVVSPMCQYRAVEGMPQEWHLVHLGARALGGAGLIIAEKTAISPEGRITPGCTGIYTPEQAQAWKRIVDFVHRESGAKIGLQLGHAGRKASCALPWEGGRPLSQGGWKTVGPSPLPFDAGWPVPQELGEAELEQLLACYVRAARFADQAGFDLIELHAAHGYLLSSFLSPLTNHRRDRYGGSLEARMRFPLAIVKAVRAAWPEHKPLAVRISATDWLEPEGMTVEDSVQLASALQGLGVDLLDVSSAGNVPHSRPRYGRMYQVPLAEEIRSRTGLPVMAVGGISTADQVNTVLAAGRADLCAIGRAHLSDPHFTHRAAAGYGHRPSFWPNSYLTVRP